MSLQTLTAMVNSKFLRWPGETLLRFDAGLASWGELGADAVFFLKIWLNLSIRSKSLRASTLAVLNWNVAPEVSRSCLDQRACSEPLMLSVSIWTAS